MNQSGSQTFVYTVSGRYTRPFMITIFLFVAMFFVQDILAQGNILVMPRRVVFEGNKKSQELTVANTGTDSAKYMVSFVQMRMKEDGSFEQIVEPDSGQWFADKYFRFFPRTVTLAPGESQVIKMQVNKPANLENGEYRSHIYFRSIPKNVPLGEQAEQRDSGSVAVRLTPVFGITIPAILRVGACNSAVVINDISIVKADTSNQLQFFFRRTGNCSVFGDVLVDYTSPEGKVTRVATVKGVAVYTPNKSRKFQCYLDNAVGVDYSKGKLVVSYVAPDDVKAAKLTVAEYTLR